MNSNNNGLLSTLQYGSMFLGITFADLENILSIIMILISIVIGILNAIILIKRALNDGKIDKEEEQEILDQINNIKTKVEEKRDNKDDK